jgi:sec-independent protein translocase protein TatA
MGGFSWVHWLLVIGVVLLLFGGRGKISELMGDFAKGIKSFKKGLSEDDKAEAEPAAKPDSMKTIDHQAPAGTTATPAPSGAAAPQPENRKVV